MMIPLEYYITVAGILFAIGVLGVLIRRNTLVVFMCLELMLNASNLALIAFSRYNAVETNSMMSGNIFVFFIITVAAAEVALGLAILVTLFRQRGTMLINEMNVLNES